MNNFQKRALAYNAYRALRKAASKGNLGELLKYAADNGEIKPPKSQSAPAPDISGQPKPDGYNMTPTRQKGFSGIFPKGPRGKSPRPKSSKRGCC